MAKPGTGVMDPDEVDEIRRYAPNGTKSLRACIKCRLIMTKEQFYDYGCPDPACRGSLDMAGSEGRVVACTSTSFQGFITLIRPGAFLSRFNGLEHKRPGCYALTVQGRIPDHILNESEMEREQSPRRGARSSRGAQQLDSESEAESELGQAGALMDTPDKDKAAGAVDIDEEDEPLLGASSKPKPKESAAGEVTPQSEISFSLEDSKDNKGQDESGEPPEKKQRVLRAEASSTSEADKKVEQMFEPDGEEGDGAESDLGL
jgi:hypothetical protein